MKSICNYYFINSSINLYKYTFIIIIGIILTYLIPILSFISLNSLDLFIY